MANKNCGTHYKLSEKNVIFGNKQPLEQLNHLTYNHTHSTLQNLFDGVQSNKNLDHPLGCSLELYIIFKTIQGLQYQQALKALLLII